MMVLFLHEYMHALGYIEEAEVRILVQRITEKCFDLCYIATRLAKLGPWGSTSRFPLDALEEPKGVMEIVNGFEATNSKYIV